MNDSAYSPGSSDSRTSDSFSSESNSSFNNNESISEDNKSSDTDTGMYVIWKLFSIASRFYSSHVF